MKLYTRPASFRAQKVIITAQFVDLKLEIDTTATAKSLKSKSPIAKLPLLETTKGCISESNAIARYVANSRPDSGLAGMSLLEKAQVDSWIDFSSNELEVPVSVLVYPIIGWMAYHPQASEKAAKDFKGALAVLEHHLKSRTFMVGNAITLADIALACALLLPMKITMDAAARKPYPCVTRWFLTCVNQPQFAKVVGEVTLCKTALKPSGAAAAPKKGEKKQEKKAEKKKEKTQAKKPEKPAPAKKAKKPDPFGHLPKSKFILDAWKKQYSNARDCYNVMPWFWKEFDKEGYSLWHAKYNYNDELKVSFMVSNLAAGFVQRCDEVRKYAFGVVQIIGKDGGPMEIVQTWLIRGQEIKPLIDANPDAEHYTFTKVTDFSDAEKKKVEHMWCAGEEIDGKEILDCKVFK